jgi:putative FmdB family regulatory protein
LRRKGLATEGRDFCDESILTVWQIDAAGPLYTEGMPIFEYACRACGKAFEVLVRGQEQPHCPACESADLDKTLSTFAVGAAAPRSTASASPGPCGRCGDPRGPGACSVN